MERGCKCGEAEKGETLQVKVTVKDAQGNPLGDIPFTLKRGDGYTRSEEKHVAGSSDALVARLWSMVAWRTKLRLIIPLQHTAP